jgi:hypothetical protein
MFPADQDHALDALLRRRRFTPARPGLSGRIIAAAHAQGRPQGFGQWLADMLAELLLPRPAYALASVLMIGVIIGGIMPDISSGAGADEEEASLQIYLDDEVNVL